MPGIVMHHHFGKVVYSALPEEIKAVLNNVNVYDYGTSAPDSFSYVNFINNKNQKDSKAFSDYVHTHKTKDFFARTIKELAGDDNHISNEEAGNYSVDGQNIGEMQNSYTDNRINSAGERLHSKVVEFFRFINSLVEQTEGVESVKNKRKKSIIKYENGTTEIRYDDGNIIVKDVNGNEILNTKKAVESKKESPMSDQQFYMINYLIFRYKFT